MTFLAIEAYSSIPSSFTLLHFSSIYDWNIKVYLFVNDYFVNSVTLYPILAVIPGNIFDIKRLVNALLIACVFRSTSFLSSGWTWFPAHLSTKCVSTSAGLCSQRSTSCHCHSEEKLGWHAKVSIIVKATYFCMDSS